MKMISPSALILVCCTVLLSACSSSNDGPVVIAVSTDAVDIGVTDSNGTDSGASDSAGTDSGTTDSAASDSGSTDSGTTDSGTTDSGTTDSGATDSGTTDSGTTDSGTTDSGTTDSGTADSGSTDSGPIDSAVLVSCEVIDAQALQNNGGVISTVLPADLSQVGAQVSVQLVADGELVAFDATSGAVDYVPGAGRLSKSIEYTVADINGVVLASHEHRWVFNPVRVMPLGDSITSGVEFFDGNIDLPSPPERVGYRKFLYDRLGSAGYPIDYHGQGGQSAGAAAGLVDPENNGFPGVDIDFINAKLLELLTEDDVDIILLHIGTNNTPANAAAIDAFLNALDLWELENHPVMAMVATITPKRDVAKNAEVDIFNEDLRARVASRTDDRVILVEQNAAVSLADISDEQIGIHPSASGYQKMADRWFEALTRAESGALSKCSP